MAEAREAIVDDEVLGQQRFSSHATVKSILGRGTKLIYFSAQRS